MGSSCSSGVQVRPDVSLPLYWYMNIDGENDDSCKRRLWMVTSMRRRTEEPPQDTACHLPLLDMNKELSRSASTICHLHQ